VRRLQSSVEHRSNEGSGPKMWSLPTKYPVETLGTGTPTSNQISSLLTGKIISLLPSADARLYQPACNIHGGRLERCWCLRLLRNRSGEVGITVGLEDPRGLGARSAKSLAASRARPAKTKSTDDALTGILRSPSR
jgi:hypothetical protein